MNVKKILFIPENSEVDEINKESYETKHKHALKTINNYSAVPLFAYDFFDLTYLDALPDVIVSGLELNPADWCSSDEYKHKCCNNSVYLGLYVLEELRKDERYLDTPLIIRTVFESDQNRHECLNKCKVSGFLTRSATDAELLNQINECLNYTKP